MAMALGNFNVNDACMTVKNARKYVCVRVHYDTRRDQGIS